jgi:uncharacterized protein
MVPSVEDMRKLLTELVRALVDTPDAVTVEAVETENNVILKLRTAHADVDKVIGLNGRTVRSLSTILRRCGAKTNRLYTIETINGQSKTTT